MNEEEYVEIFINTVDNISMARYAKELQELIEKKKLNAYILRSERDPYPGFVLKCTSDSEKCIKETQFFWIKMIKPNKEINLILASHK